MFSCCGQPGDPSTPPWQRDYEGPHALFENQPLMNDDPDQSGANGAEDSIVDLQHAPQEVPEGDSVLQSIRRDKVRGNLLSEPTGCPSVVGSGMYVVLTRVLRAQIELLPFEDMLRRHLVEPYTDSHGPLTFVSHRWSSFQHPDPSGLKLISLQAAIARIIHEDSIRTSKLFDSTGWQAISANAASKDVSCAEALRTSLRDGCWWLDYLCVPQSMDAAASRRAAVMGLSAVISRATNFLVLVPPVPHLEVQSLCDRTAWEARGWCRFERLAAELLRPRGARRPIVVRGDREPLGSYSEDFFFEKYARREQAVLTGGFACCQLGLCTAHRKPIPCDRQRLDSLMGAMMSQALHGFKLAGDIASLWKWLEVRPHLLHASQSQRNLYVATSAPVSRVLEHYCSTDIGAAGIGPGGVTVLHLASGAGDISAVRVLQDAKADVGAVDLLGFSAMTRAALYGNVEVLEALITECRRRGIDTDTLLSGRAEFQRGNDQKARSVLEYAVNGNDDDLIQLLFRSGTVGSMGVGI